MSISQDNRELAVHTPFGKDVLDLISFTGEEELSRLFRYRLQMISEKDSLPAKEIVGKRVSFRVKMPSGSPRWFNGFVSRFSTADRETGFRRYEAEVVPWLWFLTRTSDCRIFQRESVLSIIKKVFSDLGFKDFKLSISGQHDSREYCVQYRETDFNFVSRLMEEEGIFYYFKHDQDKHTLVLADNKNAYEDCPENRADYLTEYYHLTAWEHSFQFTSGKFTQTDYDHNFHPARDESPPSEILKTEEKTSVDLPDIKKYELYDYPGVYADKNRGQALTKIRMEEEEAEHDVVRGASTYKTFFPGGKFTIRNHDWKEENGKSYVITSIRHSATEPSEYTGGEGIGEVYSNTFTCIPDSRTFRPQRITPKPLIHGSQTAVVVGPRGQEIHTGAYGDVQVQFFWDREGLRKENTSCWIRCAQLFAGKGWGAMFIPRIGQEVLVSYLEGDPDRPVITGVVYNGDQLPPYQDKAKSYIKTNSTQGGNGFNELRFDDLAGHEQIYIHAQKDMDITILGDKQEVVKGANKEQIEGSRHLEIQSDRKEKVGGSQSLTVAMDQQEKVGGKHALEAGSEIHLKATGRVVIEAGAQLTIKGPGGFVDINPTGIFIQGTMVLINSGGAPGVGTGSNPSAPDAPKIEDPKTGQKSTPY